MKILFYLNHTLYAKVLIPLIVKLARNGNDIYISENRFNFLKYDPLRYGNNPASNTFVNRSSFDFVAGIINYSAEWESVKKKVKFSPFYRAESFDAVIATTKNLNTLKALGIKHPGKNFTAIGYQHMPFIISLNGKLNHVNLPPACMDIFMASNPFSELHKFKEYVSDFKISFRGFPYLEKVYNDYYLPRSQGGNNTAQYVLIFHPGGYRGVITEPGAGKKISYEKQKNFITAVCGPILKKSLTPVIKIHPLAARYHFKDDNLAILHEISKERHEFLKVIVEDRNYCKYVYKSDTIISFGSSGIYELFSIDARNVIICNFFGRARSRKFFFMKDILVDSLEDYNKFWNTERKQYFLDIYRKNAFLNKIYESYAGLFADNISDRILSDIGAA